MGKTSNDKNNVRQVYTLKINCPPEETANLQATTKLLCQSRCLKKLHEDKIGSKLSRTEKHHFTQDGTVHRSRLNQIFAQLSPIIPKLVLSAQVKKLKFRLKC